MDELIIIGVWQCIQIAGAASVGQGVQIHDMDFGIFLQFKMDEIGTDESSTTSHQDILHQAGFSIRI